MTRARVKALHDKVNSLLSMCDLDTPLNGLLLHSDTLCILRHDPLEDLQGSVEVGQESSQEDEGEGEKNGNKSQAAVLPPVAAVLPPQNQPSQTRLRPGPAETEEAGRYYRPTGRYYRRSYRRKRPSVRSSGSASGTVAVLPLASVTTAGPGGTTAGVDFRSCSRPAQRYYRWYYRCGGNMTG